MERRFWDWLHDCSLTPIEKAEQAGSRAFRVDCDWDIGELARLEHFRLELQGVSHWHLEVHHSNGAARVNPPFTPDDEFTVLTSRVPEDRQAITVLGDVSMGGGTKHFGVLELRYETDRVVVPGLGSMTASDLAALLDASEHQS